MNPSIEQQAAVYSYLTVCQFCDKHKAFKVGGVRSQIFNEDKNGLKKIRGYHKKWPQGFNK
jgi:hypothetical protein